MSALVFNIYSLQIDRKEILQRFSSKFSEGKITKDQLLTIKNFETRLDKYSSRLLETENTYFIDEKSEKKDTANDKCFSHEIIIDFINISRFKLISISQSDQSSIDNIVQLIIEKIIPPLHGPLGWSLPLSIEKLTNIEVIKDFNKITSPPKSPNHRLGSSLSQSQPSLGFEEIGTGIGLGMGIGMEEETESFSKINYGLAGLKEKEKIVLMSNCNEVIKIQMSRSFTVTTCSSISSIFYSYSLYLSFFFSLSLSLALSLIHSLTKSHTVIGVFGSQRDSFLSKRSYRH